MKVYCHIENEYQTNYDLVVIEKEFDVRPMVGDFVIIRDGFEKIVNGLTKKEFEWAKQVYPNYVYCNKILSFDDAIVVKSVSFVENKSTGKMELHIELGQ